MAETAGVLFPAQTLQPPQPSTMHALDDDAFERAFAEAENALHSTTISEPEESEEPKLSEKEEADLLAQTAGELFDRLRHERETDEKFRNSAFVTLMKKLRDIEVVVSGKDMVERGLESGTTKEVDGNLEL